MKTQKSSTAVGVFEDRTHANKNITELHQGRFSVMHAWIGMLVVSLSSVFAVASEPPLKPKPPAKSSLSTKQQAKLDAIHAKRKAVSERKHNAVANQHGSHASPEASIRDSEAKMIPNRAAAKIEQGAAEHLQLLQQQPITTAEQALWNQQRQILLMELSRQGLIQYAPNGVILPGAGLQALQVPSFDGPQVPLTAAEQALWNQERQILLMELSRQGLIQYAPNGVIVPGVGLPALQVPSFGGLQIPRH
jgi:hypothetical protein